MKLRSIADDVFMLGAQDWDRRLFDALIPLPDGTSYNSYLVRGTEKTALLDTVDPTKADVLMRQLEEVPDLDYIVVQHVEQDHSGALPRVLAKYAKARVLISTKGKDLLLNHVPMDEGRILTVEDGEVVSLGDKSLRFVYIPWAHWPETMATFVPETGVVFTCDLFGSHVAVSETIMADRERLQTAAKRYYAEIMQPFRPQIIKDVDKISSLGASVVAPSHGPIHDRPAEVFGWYADWTADLPRNLAVVPYASMHGSTGIMVDVLCEALVENGVTVRPFNMAVTDIGELATALVDAATIVLASPAILGGPHPSVSYAALLANALRPKAKLATVIGSFGWSARTAEILKGYLPNLKAEFLESVVCRGLPAEDDKAALRALAAAIATKHKELGAI